MKYKCVIGPWIWTNDMMGYYKFPDGAIGGIDLSIVPEQSVITGMRPNGFFILPKDVILDSNYIELSNEDIRETKARKRHLDILESSCGYRPEGDTLADVLFDLITSGSDPEGLDRVRPLMPGSTRKLDLVLPGYGRIKREKFSTKHKHSNKVLSVIKSDFRRCFETEQRGEHSQRNQHRRILDALCEQYHTEDWTKFVPNDLVQHIPGRIPHNTTYTESFNTSDGDTLGPDLSWTELTGDIDIVSNKAQSVTTGADVAARANHDLSSANHYVQATLSSSQEGSAADPAVIIRKDSTSTYTFNSLHCRADLNTLTFYKCIAGSYTALHANGYNFVANTDYTAKLIGNGSSYIAYIDGVLNLGITDTSITSGTRCGIRGFMSAGNAKWDNWSASDYTELAPHILIKKASIAMKM